MAVAAADRGRAMVVVGPAEATAIGMGSANATTRAGTRGGQVTAAPNVPGRARGANGGIPMVT